MSNVAKTLSPLLKTERAPVCYEESTNSASSSNCSSGRMSPESGTGDLSPLAPGMEPFRDNGALLPKGRCRTKSGSQTDDVIRIRRDKSNKVIRYRRS